MSECTYGGVDEILYVALSKSTEDRQFLLETEATVLEFMQQTKSRRLLFPRQNAYRRLLLHRLADYYDLTHVVVGKQRDDIAYYKKEDVAGSGGAVMLLGDRVPLDADACEQQQPGVRILTKKKQQQQQQEQSQQQQEQQQQQQEQEQPAQDAGACRVATDQRKTKTIEERQAEYERARAEIFQENTNGSAGDFAVPGTELCTADRSISAPSSSS
ncbi:hypothetical protein GGI26_005566 [Coemansia sp. RSA 1358]|uniref:R3H domain-containing protein n=1 Tax=Coemansia umbellata TaxID=1424467 RepID=A0ABQ8PG18_9FUNG|nr:hypothetical protein EDC05_005269 [Coemansia umbellata]KAJ2619756.1 hypothetical protein GGI26_005566 [Coemansia sp. RSA 1358]